MAVNLALLVDNLKREVNPPGSSLYPDAQDFDYEGYLADAFWELVLAGFITGYTESGLSVTEDVATPNPDNDLSKAFQQLIVISAGMRIVRMKLLDLDTQFRAVAGPAEFETRKSAQTMQAVLENLQKRFDDIAENLPNVNVPGVVYYHDVIALRDQGIVNPDYSSFVGY